MAYYFFRETKNAHAALTSLFDFAWPTAAALWNLRWQVAGYLQAVPGATNDQLDARFTEGMALHGINIRRACIDHTWEEQTKRFASLILVNTFAIYEGWIEDILDALHSNTDAKRKGLQKAGANGATSVVNQLTADASTMLSVNIYPGYCTGGFYSMTQLDAMMLCYRYFKELRNCIIHNGGFADQKLVDAHVAFQPVATVDALGVSEIPYNPVPVRDEQADFNLRGTVGFSHIVLKIMTTIDAELCRSRLAEEAFANKWRITYPKPEHLPARDPKRSLRITNMANHAGFVDPVNTEEFAAWLSDKRLTVF